MRPCRIRCISPAICRREVARRLQAADVAAFPFNAGVTRKSGSLLAAFVAGVPVVATAPPGEVGGPTEADGVLRVPPCDTTALTEALGRVLGDGVLADRLAAAGRAVAASQGWDAIAAVHAGSTPGPWPPTEPVVVDTGAATEQGGPSTVEGGADVAA